MSSSMQEFFDTQSSSWDEKEKATASSLRLLLKDIPIQNGDKVLDLACGTGILTPFLYEKTGCDVLGLDLSPKMIKKAKEKYQGNPHLHFESGDFLRFEGEGFDWIVVFNAYPHFLDVDAFVQRAYRALKPNGHLLILHNLSRFELTATHAGRAHPYSRDLDSAIKEGQKWEPNFRILEAKEGDHLFLLLGKKA